MNTKPAAPGGAASLLGRTFRKMHGLGNDFAILDARAEPLVLNASLARALADRRTGVGCDQVIVIEPATDADAFMRIMNADGSEVAACGNATRCVARILMEETGRDTVSIATRAGQLRIRRAGEGLYAADMGPVFLNWRDIPLARACDTLCLPLSEGGLSDPVAVSVGNPHAVFFVPDAKAVPLAELGPRIEVHPLFPEKTNVEVVEVLSSCRLRMRVWERGAGITRACGTGACASLVAAARRGLCGRRADVVLDGGVLSIEWTDADRVVMTGPATLSFEGRLGDLEAADGSA